MKGGNRSRGFSVYPSILILLFVPDRKPPAKHGCGRRPVRQGGFERNRFPHWTLRMRYFFPIDATRFHAEIAPTLAAAWSARSFAPARDLCRDLAPAARDSIQHSMTGLTEPLVVQIAENKLLFRKDLWRLLVGEVLLFSAEDLPELETPLTTFAALLHQETADDRSRFPPIQQAIQGGRDLSFGAAFFRPDHAGWNDLNDVRRLAELLEAVDVRLWRAEDLVEFDEADRADELEFAREWFPILCEMHRRAADRGWVMVCEEVSRP